MHTSIVHTLARAHTAYTHARARARARCVRVYLYMTLKIRLAQHQNLKKRRNHLAKHLDMD